MDNPGTSHAQQENAGAYVKRVYALQPQIVTAGTGGDGAYIDGDAINRVDPEVALSAIPAIPAHLVLASGEDCVFHRIVEHREDSTDSWAAYGDPAEDLTVEALNDGSAQNVDVGQGWNIDLSGAKPEIRIRVRPTLSASGTDTCAIGGSVVLAGFDHNPPTGN